ncbi:MAG: sugar ABC transporter permease [Chloroflexi bacterium]|nr:sugar ABC transporter permease [Chloroflexota bacterium]
MASVASQDAVTLKTARRRAWFQWNEYTLTIILFLLPTVFFMTVFVVWPIISSFELSLYKWNGIDPVRTPIGLDNWTRLLQDQIFWRAFGNNLVVVVLSIAIQMPLGMLLAIMLERAGRRLIYRIFKTVYFFPMLMSSVAIGILFKYIYDPSFGLINQFLKGVGLEGQSWLGEPNLALVAVIAVICWQYTPFYMILFLAALNGISEELRDAALIDGANQPQYYRFIALPLVRGTLRTAVILSLIGSLKYFDLIWVMTEGGPSNASELMATYMYKKAFPSFEMGYGSTVASALFIIVMVIALASLFLTRRFETEV